jgi:hypothetical protein
MLSAYLAQVGAIECTNRNSPPAFVMCSSTSQSVDFPDAGNFGHQNVSGCCYLRCTSGLTGQGADAVIERTKQPILTFSRPLWFSLSDTGVSVMSQ